MAFVNPFSKVPVDEAGSLRKIRQQRDAEMVKPADVAQPNTMAQTAMIEIRKMLQQGKTDGSIT